MVVPVFDTAGSYVSRGVSERAAIRDHFVHALCDRFILLGPGERRSIPKQAPVQNLSRPSASPSR
jgi:hypothetical protein